MNKQMNVLITLLILFCTLLAGCASSGRLETNKGKEVYQLESDKQGKITERATIELGTAEWAEVDSEILESSIFIGINQKEGVENEFSGVSLRAGAYKIKWGKKLTIPVCEWCLKKRDTFQFYYGKLYIEPGHLYRLQASEYPLPRRLRNVVNKPYYSPKKVNFWVIDLTSDEEFAPWCLSEDGESFMRLKKLAESGDVEAGYRLGILYEKRNCPEYDLSMSTMWYKKAAEQGHDEAQNRIGRGY